MITSEQSNKKGGYVCVIHFKVGHWLIRPKSGECPNKTRLITTFFHVTICFMALCRRDAISPASLTTQWDFTIILYILNKNISLRGYSMQHNDLYKC